MGSFVVFVVQGIEHGSCLNRHQRIPRDSVRSPRQSKLGSLHVAIAIAIEIAIAIAMAIAIAVLCSTINDCYLSHHKPAYIRQLN